MTKINLNNNKTYQSLVSKVKNDTRMPSIKSIHLLLVELGIKHKYDGEVTNTVERRSNGKRYVNDRYEGKSGSSIHIDTPKQMFGNINLDSSDSYYSWNSFRYAKQLVELITLLNK